MADRTHKFEISKSGRYVLAPEEHFNDLKNSTAILPSEIEFLSYLGKNVFGLPFLIKHFREQKNWNLRELGKISGIAYSQISLYENGKVTPEEKSLEKLFKTLGKDFQRAVEVAHKINARI